MDRRRFLKLFSAASVSLLAGTPGMMDLKDDWVLSKVLNLKFRVPSGWTYFSFERMLEFRENFEDLPEGDPFTPFCGFGKYDEPTPRMNPNIGVYLDQREPWMGEDVVPFAQDSVMFESDDRPTSEVKEQGTSLMVDGHRWARTRVAFDLLELNGFSERVETTTLVSFIDRYVVLLAFTDSESGDEQARDVFERVIASMSHTRQMRYQPDFD